MAWMLWLAVPIAAGVMASIVAWWRSRPRRRDDPMARHRGYLDALTVPARGAKRVPHQQS
jgi:hypothetical protein